MTSAGFNDKWVKKKMKINNRAYEQGLKTENDEI